MTRTVRTIGLKLVFGGKESERVQIAVVNWQFHPGPVIDVSGNESGSMSATLTIPVDAVRPVFLTVTV